MSDPTVTIHTFELSVQYKDLVALDLPALEASGRVIAVLGHNGAGKSTFIKTVLGLLEPSSGIFSLTDAQGQLLTPERDMAFCPENGAVFADISVERYLQLWCRIKHRDGKYYRKEGAKYVERLDISQLLKKKGRELSKGQRRRVQTALGFMSNPRLFLFDEPFDGLDVQRTNELMEIVEEERDTRAFIVSSHRMDVMERISDTIVVLAHGSVACVGAVQDVCAKLNPESGDEPAENSARSTLTDAMRAHLKAISR